MKYTHSNIALVASVQYVELELSGEIKTYFKHHFQSNQHTISNNQFISEKIQTMNYEIISKFDNYNAKNTKYRFDKVLFIDLQSDKYNPLNVGSYIPLPDWVKLKKCCINVKNIKTNKFTCEKKENFRCFEYALESILNPLSHHTDRAIKYDITNMNL